MIVYESPPCWSERVCGWLLIGDKTSSLAAHARRQALPRPYHEPEEDPRCWDWDRALGYVCPSSFCAETISDSRAGSDIADIFPDADIIGKTYVSLYNNPL